MRPIDADAAADKIMRETESHADEIGIGSVAVMIAFARALRDETDFPTIEAEPVRHGRWIDNKCGSSCSECNDSVPYNIFIIGCDFEYCPYCGAKMGD